MEIRLSTNEQKLYDLIKQHDDGAARPGLRYGSPERRINSEELTRAFYGMGVPLHGRVYVANLIRSLKRKWPHIPGMKRVESTTSTGRKPVEVWLASRSDGAEAA